MTRALTVGTKQLITWLFVFFILLAGRPVQGDTGRVLSQSPDSDPIIVDNARNDEEGLIGKTEKEVTRLLGESRGKISLGTESIWLYPRGEITFRNGIVVKHDFVPSSVLQEREDRRRRQKEEADERRHKAELERVEEERIKAAATATTYKALPNATPTNPATFELELCDAFTTQLPGGPDLSGGTWAGTNGISLWILRNMPELHSRNPICGDVSLATSSVHTNRKSIHYFVIDEDGGTGNGYDMLYFDFNQNMDLGDDSPIPLNGTNPVKDDFVPSRVVQLRFSDPFEIECIDVYGNAKPVEVIVRLALIRNGRVGIRFMTTKARTGLVRIDNRIFTAVLGGAERVHWRQDDPWTPLYLFNTNNQEELSSYWDGATLRCTHICNGQYYTFQASPDGDRLTVSPYNGELGTMEVSRGNRSFSEETTVYGTLVSESTTVLIGKSEHMSSWNYAQSAELPVGDYAVSDLTFEYGRTRFSLRPNHHSDGKYFDPEKERPSYTVPIRSDQPFIWDFPEQPVVQFASPADHARIKAGDKLDIGPSLVYQDLDLSLSYIRRRSGKYQTEDVEALYFVTDERGHTVAEGKLEYG